MECRIWGCERAGCTLTPPNPGPSPGIPKEPMLFHKLAVYCEYNVP